MAKSSDLEKALRKLGNPAKAAFLQRFFKTGPGEYAEGDTLLGITVPVIREVAKRFVDLPYAEVVRSLRSRWHEQRLAALYLLRWQFERGTAREQKRIFDLYIRSSRYINNWDLVDASATYIMGPYLLERPRAVLHKMVRSKNLWERRMAVLATFYFIRQGEFTETLKLAEKLLNDDHDLMHKPVGWMLREIGKRDRKVEEKFLEKFAKRMPRTMLRYAIEHFPPVARKKFMQK